MYYAINTNVKEINLVMQEAEVLWPTGLEVQLTLTNIECTNLDITGSTDSVG
jgi:hypothetical protein